MESTRTQIHLAASPSIPRPNRAITNDSSGNLHEPQQNTEIIWMFGKNGESMAFRLIEHFPTYDHTWNNSIIKLTLKVRGEFRLVSVW